MSKVKVRLADNIARVIFIEKDATIGAQIGTDLRMPDGTLATAAKLNTYLGTTPGAGGSGVRDHRLLRGLTLGDDHPQYVNIPRGDARYVRWTLRPATFVNESGITVPINDVFIRIPTSCIIRNVTLLTLGGPGSCVVDIRKSGYADFPPLAGDSICAATKPTIAAGIKYTDSVLTSWDKTLVAGDILAIDLESVVAFTMISVNIEVGQT